MRGRSLSILGIFAAVAGAILLLCFNTIKVTGVEITCAILFVGVGLVNLIFYSSISRAESAPSRVLSLISNAASIVLGVSMLVFQSTFIPLITFMFGLLIGVCALWQFFVLAVGARPYQLPAWLYIFPIFLGACTAYVFLRHPAEGEDHILMLASGIAFAVLGVGCILEGSILGAARRADHAKQKAALAAAASTDHTEAEPYRHTDEAIADTHYAETPKTVIETSDDLDDQVPDEGETSQNHV